jgi:hypothetical protein
MDIPGRRCRQAGAWPDAVGDVLGLRAGTPGVSLPRGAPGPGRQLPLDLARAPLYSGVAAGEVTRAVWRCDLVSGGMGGSGQGQHECGGGGAGRGCGRDHALGGQDRADRAPGTALAGGAGLPVGVGPDDRVAVALFGNPVVMSGCMTIHTPGDPAAEDRVAVPGAGRAGRPGTAGDRVPHRASRTARAGSGSANQRGGARALPG